MTMPPYEWPTSTIGPVRVRRNSARYKASPGSPRSGLPNPTARNPRSWRARICRSKPEASAQAPWTRTIVGLVSSGWVGMSAPCLRWGPAVREASPFHSVPARVIRPSRDLTLTRESLFTGMCGFPRGRDRAGSPARKGRGSPGTVGSALMSRWSSLRADSRTLQHPPEIDEKLLVDVLVPGPGDHPRLRPHRHPQLSIGFADHRADGLEQRHHLPPFHVAAGRVLVDLAHGFAVVVTQIGHRWLHWSMSGRSGIHIVVPSSWSNSAAECHLGDTPLIRRLTAGSVRRRRYPRSSHRMVVGGTGMERRDQLGRTQGGGRGRVPP